MSVRLEDTTAGAIDSALLAARRAGGGPASGHVLTLLVPVGVTAERDLPDEAIDAAAHTAAEHPSRILVVRSEPGNPASGLDAEVCGAGERGPGEVVTLTLRGELTAHAASVVLPLLLPDTPVVTFWPDAAPDEPATDPLGRLSQRRITDAATAPDPAAALAQRARAYADGDTDLSWTRITPWRSLLAAALDQPHADVRRGQVSGEPDSPSAELLAVWLECTLGITVDRLVSAGPGITAVRLDTADGQITIERSDGRLATLCSPGWPARPMALPRRGLAELMTEELRRLDPDDIYAECLGALQEKSLEKPRAAAEGAR